MRRKISARGYSLVEVLIATAILGTVLLAILTLFFLGRRNVYSGKQATRATSVATSVAEDLSALTADEIWSAFKITSTTATTSPTVDGTNYENVVVRSTAEAGDGTKEVLPTDTGNVSNSPGLLTRWRDLIPSSDIANGRVTVIFIPTQLVTAGDVTTAQVIRIRILMQWRETTRPRRVTLDTIKLNRL